MYRQDDLTDTELLLVNNSEQFKEMHDKQGFVYYQALREFYLGKSLPFKSNDTDPEEIARLEAQIDFVKSLGFIHERYIDNAILYVEALKSPLLSKEYLASIIDKYIKPVPAKAGIKQFHLLTAAVLTYKLAQCFDVSARTTLRIMELHYGYNYSELEGAYYQCKKVYDAIGDKKELEAIIDFITFWLLLDDGFSPESFEGRLGDHHHTIKAYDNFLHAYYQHCNEITYYYILKYEYFLENIPETLASFLTEECKLKISSRLNGECVNFDTNEVVGVLLITLFYSAMPNLISNNEAMEKVGFINQK